MKQKTTEMRDKIVKAAQELFLLKGYQAVSLASICEPLKIKPASLYYHFPGGKEELYMEVIKRRVRMFRSKIEELALRFSELDKILHQFAYWYVDQPPMNMTLIAEMDMPYLNARSQKVLRDEVRSCVFEPLGMLFVRYKKELKPHLEPFTLVGVLTTLLYSIHTAVKMGERAPKTLADANLAIFLHGIMS